MAYQNFYSSRLSADISAADTTVTVDVPPTVTSGRMVIEDRNVTKREIVSYAGVSGNNLTGVIRGLGSTTATTHTRNSQIRMNLTAEDISDLYAAFASFSAINTDWRALPYSVGSVVNNGGKEVVVTLSSVNLTASLSAGQRFELTRTGTVPMQCTDLESSSSQYASRASGSVSYGVSVIDDFTIEALVKLESYSAIPQSILSRRLNNTGGFSLRIEQNTGQLAIYGFNGSNYRGYISVPAVPLDRWTHVAASIDMSNNAANLYIDGKLVTKTTLSVGTPTFIVQAGDLRIGDDSVGSYFDGRIQEVRMWDNIRTQGQILANSNQPLTGAESGLLSYFPLNGNFNDLSPNANNLTGVNGATATNSANAFKTKEYGTIRSVASVGSDTAITIYTDERIIPTTGGTTPRWSAAYAPYGFPITV